jgi:hypothetical protein
LQILIESAIGKTKQLLKASDQPVPVSGYDAFNALASRNLLAQADLPGTPSLACATASGTTT